MKGCLEQKLGAYDKNQPTFQCFNVVDVKKADDSYSAGLSIRGRSSWVMNVVVVLGFVGAIACSA